ncbi:D-glycero-beta-D-manno-heptose 1-phosphate adenylyltransferase [Umezawaea beigongshangensis]|uniref:D-glycero-beta-D-manno-heptose 1-phosphate adenylyltransferase n=1 Tax=Umezawaea beigongshangensis TaxID=2780383 RepID=UPI0027DE5C69|nr:D-glycero-beta-D-manno-heptose 1-phosphate adenylyltransferase [Umezawaea beigongshangensis]
MEDSDFELTRELPRRLADAHPRVVVLGDAILDGWLTGRCHRLAREAPAPVVEVDQRWHTPGGAANTACNLAALGADVRLVAPIGDDADGALLLECLRTSGVDTTRVVVVPGRRTTSKRRVVAGEQVLVRFDECADEPLDEHAHRLVDEALRSAVCDRAAVLVCGYGDDAPGRAALAELRERIPLLVVDAHDLTAWTDLEPDLVTPNAAETERVLGHLPSGDRAAFLDAHRAELHAATGARSVVVTLDRDGAVLFTPGLPVHRTWADPAPDSRTSGAGDTFVAALTLAAAGGVPLSTAVEFAQAAADVVVRRPGTAVCGTDELVRRLGSFRDRAVRHDDLARLVSEHRAAGRRIVFTNGCFDVLHRGHVAYLNQAKRLGDVLVVALNGDESVRRLKGPRRPVNTAADRAAVLAALSCVDHVTIFDEDTPAHLLERLRPEIYAKGGDYTPQMLTETAVVESGGGRVVILDYVADQSTTAVIARIRSTS